METLLQDLRYAVRAFVRSPGFTAIALLTIAVGTGANATVFSFVSALLLEPVPSVSEPRTLAAVFTGDFSSGPYGETSYPDYLTLRAEVPAFAALCAYDQGAALVKAGEHVERTRMMLVSGEFFDLLGVRAAAGRLLGPGDLAPGAARTVVIGHGFWRRVFNGDPAAVDRLITVNGVPRTITGVAPPRFDGLTLGGRYELWLPLDDRSQDARDSRGLSVIGRLDEGATLDDARAQLGAAAARLAQAYPDTNRGTLARPQDPRPFTAVRLTRLHPASRAEVEMIGRVLMAAVAFVLLIACANVGSLLVARATTRSREVAIRLALGAGRRRLVRQMLTESALLGLAGGALGLIVALWTADLLPSFFPPEQAHLLSASVDWRVLAYTMAISLGGSVIFGLAPALQALGDDQAGALKNETRGTPDKRAGRLRDALIAIQIALAVMLLVSAGLLGRSLLNARNADLGFSTRAGVVASIELPPGWEARRAGGYYDRLLARLRSLPGVASASLASSLPLGGYSRRGFRADGYQPRAGEDTELPITIVDAAYFATLQVPLVDGRLFTASDRPGAERVVVVNERLADRFFSGRAIDRHVTDSQDTRMRVVGVVATGKYRSVREPPVPMVYYPMAQAPPLRMHLVARTAGDPGAFVEAVRRAATAIDGDVAVHRVTTLTSHLDEALAGDRLTTALVTACGAVALLLALVGVYGVVAYAVGRRRREIGVRIALGARPWHVVGLVLGAGARILVAGIAVGLAGAVAVARLLRSMLYEVQPADALTLVSVTALLGITATLAASLPVRRALGVDPVIALRE